MDGFQRKFFAVAAALLVSGTSFGAAHPLHACYTVPVQFPLKKFATFQVEQASMDLAQASGTIAIQYRLPEDIVGKGGVVIKLSGTATDASLRIFAVTEGATGTRGHCVLSSVGVTCMLHYAELKLDHHSNQIYLKQKYQDDENLTQRLEVLKTFNGDAVGILELAY